ncbi:MAG: hypothetical protein UZ22_OP11002000972 [Microgenomates bacterium OLB23]|nr:MAG: hypothetical protein UZ22_OP11002000972 [Microgenomates bacterium OLB23]
MVDLLLSGDLLGIFIKLFGVVLSVLYMFFCIILIRQLASMRKALTINDGGVLDILAYIQALLAAFLVFYALFIL